MWCEHFGSCGACTRYETGYEGQFQEKLEENTNRFKRFFLESIQAYKSPSQHYRARAEFRIYHRKDGQIDYAMTSREKRPVVITSCPQVVKSIYTLMPKLREAILNEGLEEKLFGCDFLAGSDGDTVVTLLYHKKLDTAWLEKASSAAQALGISIIGRSRKQKIVIGKDFVTQRLKVGKREFVYKYVENSFTQPNPFVNEKMIEWALSAFANARGDLLELYCGSGNFTIPFGTIFRRVLATEISKSSIAAAQENARLNGVDTIRFVRMSVEEFTQALQGVREFRRMRGVDLASYDFQNVFVDPPRSGIDANGLAFIQKFRTIVYISCNPLTLERDLEQLTQTHRVSRTALFDQFPYTAHTEMGVMLERKDEGNE